MGILQRITLLCLLFITFMNDFCLTARILDPSSNKNADVLESEFCPTFLNSNKQIPCWLLGEGKSCYCFSLFMTSWKDARYTCGSAVEGPNNNVKNNLVSFETVGEFIMVQEHINQIPELSSTASPVLGYNYWTSGRYTINNNDKEFSKNITSSNNNWEWSITDSSGKPTKINERIPIDYSNDYENDPLNMLHDDIVKGKNSFGDCLLVFHVAGNLYRGSMPISQFRLYPKFCTNPYRFICERKLFN